MRKCGSVAVLIGVAAVLFLPTANAGSITFTGSPADWGLTLGTVDGAAYSIPGHYGVPGLSGTFNTIAPASFTQNLGAGISYAVEARPLPENEGGGFCDVKAIYATFDTSNAYFAVITNSNPNGISWSRGGYGPARFGPGDLSVTNSRTGITYGIGARPIDLLAAYGTVINGATDQRTPPTWASSPYGRGTYTTSFTTSQAIVAENPTWSHVDNPGVSSNFQGYFIPTSGTPDGYATAAWKQLVIGGHSVDAGYSQYDDPYGDASMQPYSTWIYEVAVPLSSLGIQITDAISVSFSVDCGNDSLGLTTRYSVDLAAPQSTVPEPISMIFFGTGLVGVFGFVARRKMQRA